ncbi:AhpC/TSA antioxidant enzyme-domain-containing protein [Xylaria sp. FL0064]|nr:AhpC/TSA antioxidant enzyme-domain-containing protein [Xylaria sp. FL0064]
MGTPSPHSDSGIDASSVPEAKADAVSETIPGAKTEQTSNGKTEQSPPLNGHAQEEKEEKDLVNPPDFKGEVDTNNEIPSPQVLKAIENYTVFDHAGKTHPFKSLYSGHNVARRILVIFVRHFFCGNCQEYLRTLSASITPEALLGLPVSTFIAVVGCGAHELIDHYVKETGCPFPVYADPTRRLYRELGMTRTFSLGSRPAYLGDKTVAHTVVSGIVQGLKQVKTGLVTKMGDQRQVGGEFLFEPASGLVETPISTPAVEKEEGEAGAGVEEKCVTWCHRMRTTRDHAEIPELMEILGLDGNGEPSRNAKKWRKALTARKGTGLSMAGQMGRLSLDTAAKNAVAPEPGVKG